ncbi:MAG TPA: MFS transporter [Mycobacteriales bacterium]|nr:MFS transporter [Mycobacteriales bacterium]
MPGYRRLWAARTVSQWGDVVQTVTLALLVYELTGSGTGVAAVVAVEILPVLLLAPIAGALVDRLPRVRVMVVADLARAAAVALLALAPDRLWLVFAVAFGSSVGTVFLNPAAGSVLPALVDTDELVAANTGIWSAAVTSQVVLAPLAGLLVVAVGFPAGFALNAASYVASAGLLRGLVVPRPPAALERRRLLHDAADGVRHLTGDRLLRALAVAQLLAALSAGATSALLVVYAREALGVTGSGYGVLLSAIGVGAAIGPLVLLPLVRSPRRPVLVFGPMAVRGLVDLVLAATSRLPVATGALVVYGVSTSTGAVTFNAMLQAETPDGVRGRVFASMDVLWQTGRLASLAVGALVADTLGIPAVYLLGGVLLLAAAAYGLLATRGTRATA